MQALIYTLACFGALVVLAIVLFLAGVLWNYFKEWLGALVEPDVRFENNRLRHENEFLRKRCEKLEEENRALKEPSYRHKVAPN